MHEAEVIATDSDPLAVEVARANADANGARRIATACALGLDHPWLRQAAPFDLIIANILAGPLRMLAGEVSQGLFDAVAASFCRASSNKEAAAVIAAYTAHGFVLIQHRRIGDWSTLTLGQRRR